MSSFHTPPQNYTSPGYQEPQQQQYPQSYQQSPPYPPSQQSPPYPPNQQSAPYPPNQQSAPYPPNQQSSPYPPGQQPYPPLNVGSRPPTTATPSHSGSSSSTPQIPGGWSAGHSANNSWGSRGALPTPGPPQHQPPPQQHQQPPPQQPWAQQQQQGAWEGGFRVSSPLVAPRATRIDDGSISRGLETLSMNAGGYNEQQQHPGGFMLPQHQRSVSYQGQGQGQNYSGQNTPPQAFATPAPTAVMPALPPLPTVASLQNSPHTLEWAADVIWLASRGLPPTGPLTPPPALSVLVPQAVQAILGSSQPLGQYYKASFYASGQFPREVPPNPRTAFREFEASARAGCIKAWFRLGRDYEGFGDIQHAKECFERGVARGDPECAYRVGVALILKQLGMEQDVERGLDLIRRAAVGCSKEFPGGAYTYSLILANEWLDFPGIVERSSVLSTMPPTALTEDSAMFLERAASCGFAPAAYLLGRAYEFAKAPFGYDPLLSVEWYTRASEGDSPSSSPAEGTGGEADMALSKWFLCGSEGAFGKDEELAFVFAKKAVAKSSGSGKENPSALFALGYYHEIGIGTPQSVDKAIEWYEKARNAGNKDAAGRLDALRPAVSAPLYPNAAMGRQDHARLTESTLVRSRTMAREKAEREGRVGGAAGSRLSAMPAPGGASYLPPSNPAGYGAQQPPMKSDAQKVKDAWKSSQGPPAQAFPSSTPSPHNSPYMGAMPDRQNPHHGQPQPRPRLPSTGAGGGGRSSSRPPQAGRSSSRPPSAAGNNGSRLTVGVGRGGGPGGGGPGGGGSGFHGGSPLPSPMPPTATPPRLNDSGPAKPGPTTFAEMGIQGAAAKDDGCVVM